MELRSLTRLSHKIITPYYHTRLSHKIITQDYRTFGAYYRQQLRCLNLGSLSLQTVLYIKLREKHCIEIADKKKKSTMI